jgi:hypothetical protein
VQQQPATTGAGLWPDPTTGPFRFYPYWAIIDGRQELVGIELSSVQSDDGWKNPPGWTPTPTRLTADTLRKLTDGREKSLTAIVEDTKEALVSFVEWWATREPDRIRELDDQVKALKEGQRKTRGAPAKWGPEHYAAVAVIYEDAHRNSLKPTKAVAGHWGVSSSTAANWVAKARKLGLLGETTKGKAGGIRSPKGDNE